MEVMLQPALCPEPSITTFGENALLVQFEPEISTDILEQVLAIHKKVVHTTLPGCLYAIPAYTSLTIVFDPAYLSTDDWIIHITTLLKQPKEAATSTTKYRQLTLPVCYTRIHALDMEEVQTHTRLSAEEIIHYHSSSTFRVYMLGFLPGFAYMGKLPAALFCPRKAIPRNQVPRGAVGIAGFQTGLYPGVAPGGWQIIGHTPVPIFDPKRPQPFLFQPGDTVRFTPISESAHLELSAAFRHGRPINELFDV